MRERKKPINRIWIELHKSRSCAKTIIAHAVGIINTVPGRIIERYSRGLTGSRRSSRPLMSSSCARSEPLCRRTERERGPREKPYADFDSHVDHSRSTSAPAELTEPGIDGLFVFHFCLFFTVFFFCLFTSTLVRNDFAVTERQFFRGPSIDRTVSALYRSVSPSR